MSLAKSNQASRADARSSTLLAPRAWATPGDRNHALAVLTQPASVALRPHNFAIYSDGTMQVNSFSTVIATWLKVSQSSTRGVGLPGRSV